MLEAVQAAPDSASQLPPHIRRLAHVPSRGSTLRANHDPPPQPPSGSGVEVVATDPCPWFFYRGDWGTIEAPIEQPWLHTAEPPISRTTWQRLFCHLWPEPLHA